MHLVVLISRLRVHYIFLMHYAIKSLFSVIAEKPLHYLGKINLMIIAQSGNNSKMGALQI